jgi:glycosyltransferase involved in cell wall biosynthesis
MNPDLCAEGDAAPPPRVDHVALFLPNLEGGGAERALVNLARGMSELVSHVDLVVCSARGIYRKEVPSSVNIVDLQASRAILSVFPLVRYIRRRRPSRLYAALEEANIVAMVAKSLARVPIKVFPGLRNTLSQEIAQNGSLKMRVMERLARFFYRRADGLTAVSQGVADDAAVLFSLPRERIVVIANPTLTPDLREQAGCPLNHPWFAPGQPPVLLGCGRLAPQKDFATLLEAFAMLRRDRPARLVILGEGPQREMLQNRAADLRIAGDVLLAGFDPNPFRYMARAALFVLSSIHEGSPNVLVQALACGCAVVATDCPSGPREMLRGVSGARLVPVGDATAMAAAAAELLEDCSERFGARYLPDYHYRTAAAAYLAVGAER